MMKLEFDNISVSIKNKEILKGVNLETKDKNIVGIIGPNGSGKSTLIKTLFLIAEYQSGRILLNGKDIKSIRKKEIARKIAYIGQDTSTAFEFTAKQIIEMGRYPYGSKARDLDKIVRESLKLLDIEHFINRNILTLSGGERKLVYLARAIAQETEMIVLDEPTNHLDIKHQIMILNYLKNSGKSVLMVIHDLNLAAKFCDELYLLSDGQVYASGSPKEVLTKENVKNVFEVNGELVEINLGDLDFKISFEEF
ncbi:ABC transporter ATP-binding protein [Metaclostridioides mangenotii]|uniref:ABC transporter ATP-binding protein n=1 Tax=Metaclostridioides mangenotii TaxID=1540 RepID=UPI000571E289|nr:ABC transporter ATP-binding protein [Clostridioides mangenotii]